MIPLEDTASDIAGKAIRGLGLSAEDVASASGLPAHAVALARDGGGSPDQRSALAAALGLDPSAFEAIASGAWHPGAVGLPEGCACFTTDYNGMGVNSFVVWDPASLDGAIFDTGADASGMIAFCREKKISVKTIFLTHTHTDHVADIAALKRATGAAVIVHEHEKVPGAKLWREGDAARFGVVEMEMRLTSGHSRGSVTYVVRGLRGPVAIVGDAIFAGSVGGPNHSYADTLGHVRDKILALPPETVLCPGHGPLTTVALELAHNPFFAKDAKK